MCLNYTNKSQKTCIHGINSKGLQQQEGELESICVPRQTPQALYDALGRQYVADIDRLSSLFY